MPYKPGRAFVYAILLWLTGFIWGSIVFMTPALMRTPAIRYISKNPAISFPILLLWFVLTFLLAKRYLKNADDKAGEGLKLGFILAGVNLTLDFLVLVLLLKAGFGYFLSATVWLAYLMLITIPWLTGRSLETSST